MPHSLYWSRGTPQSGPQTSCCTLLSALLLLELLTQNSYPSYWSLHLCNEIPLDHTVWVHSTAKIMADKRLTCTHAIMIHALIEVVKWALNLGDCSKTLLWTVRTYTRKMWWGPCSEELASLTWSLPNSISRLLNRPSVSCSHASFLLSTWHVFHASENLKKIREGTHCLSIEPTAQEDYKPNTVPHTVSQNMHCSRLCLMSAAHTSRGTRCLTRAVLQSAFSTRQANMHGIYECKATYVQHKGTEYTSDYVSGVTILGLAQPYTFQEKAQSC